MNLDFFDAILRFSIFGVYIDQGIEGRIVFANKRFAKILEYESPDDIIGKSILDFVTDTVKEEIKANLKKRAVGQNFVVEYKNYSLLSKSNTFIPVSAFAYTIEYENKPSGLVLVLDRTKERSYEKLFFTLSQINQLIVRVNDEEELLKKSCDIIVDEAGFLYSTIGYIDENLLFKQIYTKAKTKELEETVRNLTIGVDEQTPYGKGSVSKAYHTKKVSLIPNAAKQIDTSYWHDFYNAYNIHSTCSIPILKGDKVKYILLINDTLYSFDEDHLHLLEELQLDLSFALEKIESQKNMLVLNQAISISHEWVVITDKDGTILDANKAVSDISGYSKEELIGQNPRIFKSGHHDKTFYEKLWKKILAGESCTCRFVNKAKDGSIFYLNSTIIPVMQNGEVYRFVDLSMDVTKLVEYEDQLELKSRIYNTLYEISNLSLKIKTKEEFLSSLPMLLVENLGMEVSYVVLKSNKNFEVVYFSAKDDRFQGYLDKAKMVGRLFTNNKFLQSDEPLIKSLNSKGIYLLEDICSQDICPFREFVCSYGFNSCIALSISFKEDIIGSLVLIFTESLFNNEIFNLFKVIQQQIEFILNKLEDEKFSKITLSALDAGFEFVAVTDSNFNIVYVNDRALRISGYSKDEIIGKHHSIFSPRTHTKEFLKNFYKILKSGNTYSGLMKYRMKNGLLKDFYVNIMPFFEGLNITHYIAVGKEIEKDDELLRELDRLVNYDGTTGLINLNSFKMELEKLLERAKSENQIFSVAIINPLNFKRINEAYGFEVGDYMLKKIAQRLKDNLKAYDVIAKLESDRFGILVKDLKAEEDILIVVSKILSGIIEPYEMLNKNISVSFNIGLSLFPRDANTSEDLLNKAMIALADAKEKGENQIGFFRQDLEIEATKALRLKLDLDLAVANKEFIAFYQPYVNKDRKIVGAEALMRWNKDGKIIPPIDFIEYLEKTPLIIDAEHQLIENVLDDLQSFKKTIPISINLSSKSLMQRSLREDLFSKLKFHHLQMDLLKIEIVERAFINSFDYISDLIRELKKYGIYFSLDDFGTGFSSLSYLSMLDIETLKIDISFIRDIENYKTRNIINSIIFLAHSLNIKTIAEGVETVEQFDILKSMNCDYFQGYLFYRPMPRDELGEILGNI
ncbi:PAS domain S-box-containing protein/diguanylate cyclase (GGDEF) domain-containing protein [Thermodesulfobium acidiphilum]|uniref:PAS domain S-box-containing protein/diguanylate cyclase (GGDEF) domain-containing protein n=1 Tax=Thermodesulfobium acidiphilum TaxID=1794699 RepID=A0A2R4W1E0_THEAF|nr:EAL domain-containing protein [Thermodesulfobium acidiphilum]AWB10526.1 PAS domain S-box-containing protein/diguanylate cyclase (GGDEF) domain-containing protein [Thermodesulfobium acidiphilum]